MVRKNAFKDSLKKTDLTLPAKQAEWKCSPKHLYLALAIGGECKLISIMLKMLACLKMRFIQHQNLSLPLVTAVRNLLMRPRLKLILTKLGEDTMDDV